MLRFAIKNIIANRLGTLLSIILIALSVALVVFFMQVDRQFQSTMERNSAGVHLILAAKGSPLQSVLCNLYHIDNPTGNIRIGDVKAFFNPRHPLIDLAIPLSIGDSYRGRRIVGTTRKIASLYNLDLEKGLWWEGTNEIVAGARAAEQLGLSIGDGFESNHGLTDDGMGHTHDDELVVKGILAENGSVMDNVLLTSYETIWTLHGHEHHDHEENTDAADSHNHAHDHDHHHSESDVDRDAEELANLLSHTEESITSVLLTFKNHNHQTLNMMRSINENSPIQASNPAWELNRLYSMVGVGTQLLSYLAGLIGIVSILSVFLSLLQSLRSRKYELALLRALGASSGKVFRLILLEGLIQVVVGLAIGLSAAHIGILLFSSSVSNRFQYSIRAGQFGSIELVIIVVTIVLGILAALWPAMRAYRTDVSKSLQEGQD